MQSQQLRVAQGSLVACYSGSSGGGYTAFFGRSRSHHKLVAFRSKTRTPGAAPALNRVPLTHHEAPVSVVPAVCPNAASKGEWLGALIWRFSSESRHQDLLARVDISRLSDGVAWRLSPATLFPLFRNAASKAGFSNKDFYASRATVAANLKCEYRRASKG
ncbi:hypothetical protein MRX96_027439 [Rhipicephalus microplus]